MKRRATRYIVYPFVALALYLALRYTPPLPDPDAKPADLLVSQAAQPSWRMRFDTLGRGETLNAVLKRGGLTEAAVGHALEAAFSVLDERRVPAGMPVTIRSDSTGTISEVTLQLAVDHFLHLQRTSPADSGAWTGRDEKLAWKTDTILVAGLISSNLYRAMDSSAATDLPKDARDKLTNALADVYEYRVDMSRELQKGDQFKVMAERMVAPTGLVRIGRVLAASFTLSGATIKAIRFGVNGDSGYFDQNGKSMRTAFLRAPLEFRRISSVFGGREHPILGIWRMHKGTDYAAASGTPVRAIGDGVVLRAGWSTGYGNLLEIRHPNGFVTRYGHLRAFAHGIHPGVHVKIEQTVGYVGMTGLATGPHLHFEVLVNGVQRDSRVALRNISGFPVPASARNAFEEFSSRTLAMLDTPTNGVTKLVAMVPATPAATQAGGTQ